jgi:hypothetical protein
VRGLDCLGGIGLGVGRLQVGRCRRQGSLRRPAARRRACRSRRNGRHARPPDEEAAANQQKLCADAQDRYKKLLEGRHLYKVGDDGQRQYMTSDQIDTERASAKQEVDTVCNSST